MTTAHDYRTGPYNAAVDLIGRNLAVRPDKVAFIDDAGHYTFADVAERADRAAGALLRLGMSPGARIVVCMLDGIDFVAVFLGPMKVGLAPLPLHTLFSAEDYSYL